MDIASLAAYDNIGFICLSGLHSFDSFILVYSLFSFQDTKYPTGKQHLYA